jgi:branched-chain amino acid aminotransferase
MKMEALTNGYAEAIALGPGGMISEGSGQNLFIVRGGKLMTPALDGTFLPGITRDAVITIAKDAGIEVIEAPLAREQLYIADEAFFSGTAAEITPIRSVDRIPVGAGTAGELTLMLQDRLLGIARGKYRDPHDWRWPVKVEAGVA